MIIYAFINNGTDCYMNSVLQVLLTEYELINHLYKNREKILLTNNLNYKLDNNDNLLKNKRELEEMKLLIGINLLKYITIILYKIYNDIDLHDEQDNILLVNNNSLFIENNKIIPYEIDMKIFKKIIINYFGDNFSKFSGQKDSHEFLNKLLYYLNIGLKHINLYYDYFNKLTIIDYIYSGNISTKIKSIECNHSSNKNTHYDYFELNIPINLDVHKENPLPNNTDIQIYIDEYFKKEKLFNENKWKCEKCNKYCNAIINTFIGKTPETLIILLKRFDNNGTKIKKSVLIKKNINIINSNTLKINYTLQSCIMHIGNTLLSGHYITLAKYFNNEWFICDDNRIKKQKNFDINNGFNSSNVYILFYKKNNIESS
jgi:ubiquitin C-terminal hydrolase